MTEYVLSDRSRLLRPGHTPTCAMKRHGVPGKERRITAYDWQVAIWLDDQGIPWRTGRNGGYLFDLDPKQEIEFRLRWG